MSGSDYSSSDEDIVNSRAGGGGGGGGGGSRRNSVASDYDNSDSDDDSILDDFDDLDFFDQELLDNHCSTDALLKREELAESLAGSRKLFLQDGGCVSVAALACWTVSPCLTGFHQFFWANFNKLDRSFVWANEKVISLVGIGFADAGRWSVVAVGVV